MHRKQAAPQTEARGRSMCRLNKRGGCQTWSREDNDTAEGTFYSLVLLNPSIKKYKAAVYRMINTEKTLARTSSQTEEEKTKEVRRLELNVLTNQTNDQCLRTLFKKIKGWISFFNFPPRYYCFWEQSANTYHTSYCFLIPNAWQTSPIDHSTLEQTP